MIQVTSQGSSWCISVSIDGRDFGRGFGVGRKIGLVQLGCFTTAVDFFVCTSEICMQICIYIYSFIHIEIWSDKLYLKIIYSDGLLLRTPKRQIYIDIDIYIYTCPWHAFTNLKYTLYSMIQVTGSFLYRFCVVKRPTFTHSSVLKTPRRRVWSYGTWT